MLATWYTQTDTPLNVPIKITKSNTQLVNQEKQLIYLFIYFLLAGHANQLCIYHHLSQLCVCMCMCVFGIPFMLQTFALTWACSWTVSGIPGSSSLYPTSAWSSPPQRGSWWTRALAPPWCLLHMNSDWLTYFQLTLYVTSHWFFFSPSTFIHGDKLVILFIAIR